MQVDVGSGTGPTPGSSTKADHNLSLDELGSIPKSCGCAQETPETKPGHAAQWVKYEDVQLEAGAGTGVCASGAGAGATVTPPLAKSESL